MKLQNWINWHRTLGFFATLFVLVLAVTGLLLNHTGGLRLDEIYIENDTLLDWYGIKPDQPPLAYFTGAHWLTQIDNRLYFDDREIPGDPEPLLGAVMSRDIIMVAFAHSLYLLTQTGDLIEKVTMQQGIPGVIRMIGTGPENEIIIRTGSANYYADADLQEWRPYRKIFSNWSASGMLPVLLQEKLLRLYRGKGLSMERLLVDLHSGRIFGKAGAIVVDLAAILFIILAISGWCVWLKRRTIQNQVNGKFR